MVETNQEYMAKVRITIQSGEKMNEICSVLRGLMYAIDSRKTPIRKKNKSFQKGFVHDFGTGPMARRFIEEVNCFLKKKIRERIILELVG